MIFIETPVFTKTVQAYIPDDHYRSLQVVLLDCPSIGVLIRGSGGLRKIRWSMPGQGKRGSLRIIYFWDAADTIFMLLVYKKSAQDNLSEEQLRLLKRIVGEWLK